MRATLTRKIQAITLAASCSAACQIAVAIEPVDALVDEDAHISTITALTSQRLVESDALDMLRETARQAHASRAETQTTLRPLDIKRVSMPAMIEKMIELDALPFVKVSEKDTHRVYFGISFDGVLGLHGNF